MDVIQFANAYCSIELANVQELGIAHSGLMPEEIAVIRHYTSSGYTQLNQQLRGQSLQNENIDFSNHLSTALAKLPSVAERTLVYRGACLSTKRFQDYQNALKSETSIIEFAFLSTSVKMSTGLAFSKNCAGNMQVVFKINTQKGRAIQLFSAFPQEKEVLLDKNTSFRVAAIEFGSPHNTILLEEL